MGEYHIREENYRGQSDWRYFTTHRTIQENYQHSIMGRGALDATHLVRVYTRRLLFHLVAAMMGCWLVRHTFSRSGP